MKQSAIRAPKPSTLRVKPRSYQPTKAELEADVGIETTPDELAEAVLRPVNIIEDDDA